MCLRLQLLVLLCCFDLICTLLLWCLVFYDLFVMLNCWIWCCWFSGVYLLLWALALVGSVC